MDYFLIACYMLFKLYSVSQHSCRVGRYETFRETCCVNL